MKPYLEMPAPWGMDGYRPRAKNRDIDRENRDRYDLRMMKLTTPFEYDGREADLEVIDEGPNVVLNIKILHEVVDTEFVHFGRTGAELIAMTREELERGQEVVIGRRKEGMMISHRMTKDDFSAWVRALEVFTR